MSVSIVFSAVEYLSIENRIGCKLDVAIKYKYLYSGSESSEVRQLVVKVASDSRPPLFPDAKSGVSPDGFPVHGTDPSGESRQ
jgi:hypothetical protein